MPPLCTAGYGISIGNMGYFLGAMYLFLINSVFIALSAMIVSQLLKLPKKTHLLSHEIKNKNITIVVVALLTVVPSFILGVTLVRKENFKADADHYVSKVEIWEGNYLMDSKIDVDNKQITLIYGGNEFDDKAKDRLIEKAKDLDLGEAKIIIKQGLKITDWSKMKTSDETITLREKEIGRLRNALILKQQSLDSLKVIPETGESILKELKTLYPQVESCSYAPTYQYIDSTKSSHLTNMVFLTTSDTISMLDQYKIKRWLKVRLNTNRVELKF